MLTGRRAPCRPASPTRATSSRRPTGSRSRGCRRPRRSIVWRTGVDLGDFTTRPAQVPADPAARRAVAPSPAGAHPRGDPHRLAGDRAAGGAQPAGPADDRGRRPAHAAPDPLVDRSVDACRARAGRVAAGGRRRVWPPSAGPARQRERPLAPQGVRRTRDTIAAHARPRPRPRRPRSALASRTTFRPMIRRLLARLVPGLRSTDPRVYGPDEHPVRATQVSAGARQVTRRLKEAGFKGFIVGGRGARPDAGHPAQGLRHRHRCAPGAGEAAVPPRVRHRPPLPPRARPRGGRGHRGLDVPRGAGQRRDRRARAPHLRQRLRQPGRGRGPARLHDQRAVLRSRDRGDLGLRRRRQGRARAPHEADRPAGDALPRGSRSACCARCGSPPSSAAPSRRRPRSRSRGSPT